MKKQKSKKEKSKKKFNITRIILLIFIFTWAILVFNLSGQEGEESTGLSRKVVSFFIKDESKILLIEPYVRKLAHFSEYALGGMLFLFLFSTYKWSDRKQMLMSIGLGIWYASTDEIHQLMVPNRIGSIVDVYIDTLGFSTGVCLAMIVIKLIEIYRIKNKKVITQ